MTKCIQLPKPRTAFLRHIIDPETLEELDKGLILWFPGPRSFTGEDACEFHVHGGPAVVKSVLGGLSKLRHFRPAEAGDFTKRAFFAGKLDLTEVEGLADLIHAETDLQRKQALYQMEGNLSNLYKKWREILLKNLAHLEAYIDFSEDDLLGENIIETVNDELMSLKKEISHHLEDGRKGERLRDGIQTAIIGEPNVGKSSLLNALCQTPAAIVTPYPGTTRDTIQMHININGFPITLVDTAGLRFATNDIIEKEGIFRAEEKLQNSDLIFIVVDARHLQKHVSQLTLEAIQSFLQNYIDNLNLTATSKSILKKASEGQSSTPKLMFLINKIDLLIEQHKNSLQEILSEHTSTSCISCKSEEGFKKLLDDVTKALQKLCCSPSKENPSLTQSRHRHQLNATLKYLNEYFTLIDEDATVAAQRLRLSVRHLGKIIGVVGSDEILNIIFKDFCIGK